MFEKNKSKISENFEEKNLMKIKKLETAKNKISSEIRLSKNKRI